MAIYLGGLTSGVLAGWLADRYGPMALLLASAGLQIFGSMLTPLAVQQLGFWATFALRTLMGKHCTVLTNLSTVLTNLKFFSFAHGIFQYNPLDEKGFDSLN